MPFGAVSAVYVWDRLGEAVAAILREVFLFPASRYVDDLSMPAWASISSGQRVILLEVVDTFGLVFSPAKIPPPSASMLVLGVLVTIDQGDIKLAIEKERLQFWREELVHFRKSKGIQRRALASRMAGHMEFAASAAWGSVPRARFNGLYKIASKGFRGSLQAELDVEWLPRLLGTAPPSTVKPLVPRTDPPLILYTDASGQPQNGFGAVLIDGGSILWTGCRCPSSLIFRPPWIGPPRSTPSRSAASSLASGPSKRSSWDVASSSTSTTRPPSGKKGRSSAPGFNELVFFARGICSSCGTDPMFIWVPSDCNWSDAPNRYAPPIAGFWISPVTKWQALSSALPENGGGAPVEGGISDPPFTPLPLPPPGVDPDPNPCRPLLAQGSLTQMEGAISLFARVGHGPPRLLTASRLDPHASIADVAALPGSIVYSDRDRGVVRAFAEARDIAFEACNYSFDFFDSRYGLFREHLPSRICGVVPPRASPIPSLRG